MKNFFKKYGFMIILFLVITIWLVKGTFDANDFIMNRIEDNATSRQYCEENIDTIDDPLKATCLDILNSEPMSYMKNFYVLLTHVKVMMLFRFNFLLIFIVIVPASFLVCSKLKKNHIKSDTYQHFRKNLFQSAYSSVWIFPLALCIVFMISAFLTQNFSNSIPRGEYIGWGKEVTSNPIFFSVCYLFHILCYSFTYANTLLIVTRKCHNPFLAILITLLSLTGMELFLESFGFSFLKLLFPAADYGILFNVMNSVTFNDQYGLWPTLMIGIFWCLLSYFMARLCYRNQEKLLLDCEKDKNFEK